MKITQFFSDVLGAKVKNARFSWGAVSSRGNRVFLRVWKDQIETDREGQKVQVYWQNRRTQSNGYAERLRHLKAIAEGAQGIGILCEAVDEDPDGPRDIKSYDEDNLLLLGSLSEDEHFTYARIIGTIRSDELKDGGIVEDLKSIFQSTTTDSTTVQLLVDARVGQGEFRAAVLKLWNNRCCVTGSSTVAAVRASHIKPWRDSTDAERLDPNNGLPLIATLDALFDAGMISFNSLGEMLVSPAISDSEREVLGVVGKKLSMQPSTETVSYLALHAKNSSFQ